MVSLVSINKRAAATVLPLIGGYGSCSCTLAARCNRQQTGQARLSQPSTLTSLPFPTLTPHPPFFSSQRFSSQFFIDATARSLLYFYMEDYRLITRVSIDSSEASTKERGGRITGGRNTGHRRDRNKRGGWSAPTSREQRERGVCCGVMCFDTVCNKKMRHLTEEKKS